MRKYICFFIALVVADQLIKLIIVRCFIGVRFDIIPTFLFFKPSLNDYLYWLAVFDIPNPPLFYRAVFKVPIMVIWCFAARYLSYILSFFEKCEHLLKICSVFLMSGMFCSFIDTTFWKGSWDYIGVYRANACSDCFDKHYNPLFIFDLKDAYISVAQITILLIIVIFIYNYCKHYYKISDKQERKIFDKSLGIPYWIKSGFPLQYKK